MPSSLDFIESTKVWPSHTLENMAVSDLRVGDIEQLPIPPLTAVAEHSWESDLKAQAGGAHVGGGKQQALGTQELTY